MRKYKYVKIPFEAWEGFSKKKNVMENILKEELKKNNAKVSFADTLRYFSQKPVYIYNEEVVNFLSNKKKKAKNRQTVV